MKVGDKVICIDDSPGKADGKKILVKDKIYKVIAINHCTINHQIFIDGDIKSWLSSRFRKLDDSFATSVLEKVTEQIKEDGLVNG